MLLEMLDGLLQMLAWIALIAALYLVGIWTWRAIEKWLAQRRRERRAETEAMLDRKQAELRRAVLQLADALVTERVAANQTSEDMIRAAYLARGQSPQR